MAIITSVSWYLIVILICICLTKLSIFSCAFWLFVCFKKCLLAFYSFFEWFLVLRAFLCWILCAYCPFVNCFELPFLGFFFFSFLLFSCDLMTVFSVMFGFFSFVSVSYRFLVFCYSEVFIKQFIYLSVVLLSCQSPVFNCIWTTLHLYSPLGIIVFPLSNCFVYSLPAYCWYIWFYYFFFLIPSY